METLKLNDGTVIQNAETIQAVVGLWIHIRSGLTIQSAFSLFTDPEKTSRITTDKAEPYKPDDPIVYDGYTNLFSIRQEDDGGIVIGLKGVAADA